MKKLTYVANWKMNIAPEEALTFYHDNYEELYALADNTNIVLCPSFVTIGALSPFIRNTELFLGAQNCSEYESGAYTGEVNALSLKQLDCSYCIIGHSERRQLFGETDAIIAQKIKQLLNQQIIPIVCVGETLQENQQQQTFSILEKQLAALSSLYQNITMPLIIAYEPVWAIGSGSIPTLDQLTPIIAWLRNYGAQQLPHITIRYLYGGSVNPATAKTLKALPTLDGFLIGGASGDFQTFKNIVV